MWQKLMIFTSEGALHDGQPVHRAIVQRAPPLRRPRSHRPTRHLGLRRRPHPARRPPAPTRPAGTRAHRRHRLTRADRGILRDHRRPHQRPWGRDQRDGPRPDRDYRNGPTRWPSPSTTLLLNLATNVPHTCHSDRPPPGSDGHSAPSVTSADGSSLACAAHLQGGVLAAHMPVACPIRARTEEVPAGSHRYSPIRPRLTPLAGRAGSGQELCKAGVRGSIPLVSTSDAGPANRSPGPVVPHQLRSRCTTQVCVIVCGPTAPTASGRPLSPSQTIVSTSFTPRFLHGLAGVDTAPRLGRERSRASVSPDLVLSPSNFSSCDRRQHLPSRSQGRLFRLDFVTVLRKRAS